MHAINGSIKQKFYSIFAHLQSSMTLKLNTREKRQQTAHLRKLKNDDCKCIDKNEKCVHMEPDPDKNLACSFLYAVSSLCATCALHVKC
jgi:hypothetical protein